MVGDLQQLRTFGIVTKIYKSVLLEEPGMHPLGEGFVRWHESGHVGRHNNPWVKIISFLQNIFL